MHLWQDLSNKLFHNRESMTASTQNKIDDSRITTNSNINLIDLYKSIHGLPFRFNRLGERSLELKDPGLDYTSNIFTKTALVMLAPGRPEGDASFKEIMGAADSDKAGSIDTQTANNAKHYYSTYNYKLNYTDYFDEVGQIFKLFLSHIDDSIEAEFKTMIGGDINGVGLHKYFQKSVLRSYLPLESGNAGDRHCNILFANDGGLEDSDTFSNTVGDSVFKNKMPTSSPAMNEARYMLNTKTPGLFGGVKKIASLLGIGDSISKVSKVIIPQVWQGSERSESDVTYNFVLSTPYGDQLSVAKDIYLPFSLLMPFFMEQEQKGLRKPPFILKTYTKGAASIVMGMVTSATISKSEEHSNMFGQPTLMKITLTVKELYNDVRVPETLLANSSILQENYYFSNFVSTYTGHNINMDKGIGKTLVTKAESVWSNIVHLPQSIAEEFKVGYDKLTQLGVSD